jgi:16S rRNA (cytosine1402-N4)-methyltransferase
VNIPVDFSHQPVLLEEVIAGLQIKPEGIYADCTLGGGGHSEAILRSLSPQGTLIAFDQDTDAINAAEARLAKFTQQKIFIHANFAKLKAELSYKNITDVDGFLFDIGVSSFQLDNDERGFSYQHDAELDMRMDRTTLYTAKEAVNTLSSNELTKIISTYGEENWAKRIAEFIVVARQEKEISSTLDLVEIIKKAIPAGARKSGPHPAKRTFQALRIFINQELEVLKIALTDAVQMLKPHGRICVITFHSLEDRIVKEFFRDQANPCSCPKIFPICTCNNTAQIKLISHKPIIPSAEEIANNPRARSAKLRVAEKL